MADTVDFSLLQGLSQQLASVVESAAPGVVRVDDGSRLTASGLIWESDGVILTTSHGVEQDEEIAIELHDGTTLDATLAGRDDDTDLAVLRVRATGLPAVRRAPADEVKVGHLMLAIGRPGDAGLQATIGIVSARLESQSGGHAEHVLHTDAILYPGFSGGALVDTEGRVAGLLNRGFGRGIGVALGVPILEHVAGALLAQGRVRRGYLGISTQAVLLPDGLRRTLNLAQERGLLIAGVGNGTPAEAGGLLLGDTLLALDGAPVEDAVELRRRLRAHPAGQSVTLRLLRGGALLDLTVTLGSED